MTELPPVILSGAKNLFCNSWNIFYLSKESAAGNVTLKLQNQNTLQQIPNHKKNAKFQIAICNKQLFLFVPIRAIRGSINYGES